MSEKWRIRILIAAVIIFATIILYMKLNNLTKDIEVLQNQVNHITAVETERIEENAYMENTYGTNKLDYGGQ